MSAIVQIGLHYSCEYLRLLPEYVDSDIDEMPLTFTEFGNEKWTRYIGVDMNRECIVYHKNNELYNTDKRVSFVHELVHETDGMVCKHQGFQVMQGEPDDLQNYKYVRRSISLNTLLEQLDVIPELLVLDVEGVECPILKGYNFQRRPRYIIVEAHCQEDIMTLKGFMSTKGYCLVEFTRSGGPPTAEFPLIQHQMGFIDKACLSEHAFYLE